MIYLSPVLPELTKKLSVFLNCEPQSWNELNSNFTDHLINPYEHVLKRLVPDDVHDALIQA